MCHDRHVAWLVRVAGVDGVPAQAVPVTLTPRQVRLLFDATGAGVDATLAP
jgi:hypothetical protein